MPLPLSGLISLDMVATELAIPNTNLELGDIRIRTLANKLTGDISLSDLYGKTVAKSVSGEYVVTATYGSINRWDVLVSKNSSDDSVWSVGTAKVLSSGKEQPLGSEIGGNALLLFGTQYSSNGFGGQGDIPTVIVRGNHSTLTCRMIYNGRSTQTVTAQVTTGLDGISKTTWRFPYDSFSLSSNTPVTFVLK